MSSYHIQRLLAQNLTEFLRRPLISAFSGKQLAGTNASQSYQYSRNSASDSHSAGTIPGTSESNTPVHPHLRPPRKLRQVIGDQPASPAISAASADKSRKPHGAISSHDQWSVVSFCTAAEYKLNEVKKHLQSWRNVSGASTYQLADSFLTDELLENAVHYKLSRRMNDSGAETLHEDEQGEMFIFSAGAVVFWNVPKSDAKVVLKTLKQFEVKPYPKEIVEHEAEHMQYSYMKRADSSETAGSNRSVATHIAKLTSDGQILLDQLAVNEPQLSLVKYAFSDAIAMSVKLATYESLLQNYVMSIENSSEDLKTRGNVAMTKDQVLRKTGELFDLRHAINLGSNMLDPPDFYWDREDLETQYRVMCAYLNIPRRTKVINEKLNHCYALLEFMRDHLNNQKSVRLELWIIALITVEVFFEMLHFGEDYRRREALFAVREEKKPNELEKSLE